jgi:hypothetical protein
MNVSPFESSAVSGPSTPRLFRSFWMAGFECASHVNRLGERLDMISGTEHDLRACEDYSMLRSMGICAARDGLRWHLIDRDPRYDFSSFAPMLAAAEKAGVQVVWDLCHYGWPDGVDFFSPAFVDRFARFCSASARFISEQSGEIPFFAPVNEISFLSYAIGAGIIAPFREPAFGAAKKQLVRAALAGMDAIWAVDSRARFIHQDPIIHVVPPRDRPDLAAAAAQQTESQYEAWDMIAGRACPELGGGPRYLDIPSVSLYHSNQWEFPESRLRWEDAPRDDRWVPFHRMIGAVYDRYQRPLLVGETSHFGVGRAPWIREMAAEVSIALGGGIPVEAICLYPILDRYDWENRNHWHNSGLWDLARGPGGQLRRVLNEVYADEVRRAQTLPGMNGCDAAAPRPGPEICAPAL